MKHKIPKAVVCFLFSVALAPAMAADKKKESREGEAKEVAGMSIVGNNEAPKSLYIVPWKSSEIGSDNGLTSGLLNDSLTAVDREVFMRELDFYEVGKSH
jgi:hypothetical protein